MKGNAAMKRVALAFAAALVASPAFAADKLTVLLDWYVNPDHAPIIVALEGGYFARHDLDVDLQVPSDASAGPKLVAAGKADVAISYQPDLMLQTKEGLPVVRFGTLIDSPLNCLIALKDGPVKALVDLKGKTVGFSITSFQRAYLDAILGTVGLSSADVKTVNLNFNLMPPLLAGQVDAVMDGYRNVELIQLEAEGHAVQAWFPEENGVPAYDELIYETAKDKTNDPRLPRFLAAIAEATAFIKAEPDQALALFLKSHTDLDNDLTKKQFAATVEYFPDNPGELDRARYLGFAGFLTLNGLLEKQPPLDTFAVELPAAP
jgi:putative hydroxymethylpyrimidine transport system substrate-binding protein